MTIFRCDRLLTPFETFEPGDLEVTDGRVARAGPSLGACDVRLAGSVVPGLFDLQVNGFAGRDVGEATSDAVAAISRALVAEGVTAWAPTIVSCPERVRLAALQAIAAATAVPAGAIGESAGRLAPGLPADFVVLDDDWRPMAIYAGGIRVDSEDLHA